MLDLIQFDPLMRDLSQQRRNSPAALLLSGKRKKITP